MNEKQNVNVLGGYCTSANLYNKKNGKPDPNGILSEVIFGPLSNFRCACGFLKNKTLDSGKVCPKCNVLCDSNSLRLKTFGKIKLMTPVIKTTKKNELIKLIGKNQKQLLDPKQADANAALTRFISINRESDELVVTNSSSDSPSQFQLIPFPISGLFSLIFVLNFIHKNNLLPSVSKIFEDGCIIDELDVLPPDVRPVFKDPKNPTVLRYEEINKFYISILNSNKRNSFFFPTLLEEIKIFDDELIKKIRENDVTEIENLNTIEYDQIAAFYQVYVDHIYNWCFEHIKGKEGLVRSTILSRTLEFSGRAVVVVDPNVRPYELKAPREMLYTLWFPYFLNYLVSKKIMRYDECYYRVVEKNYNEVRKDKELFQYFLDFLNWFTNSEEAKHIE